MSLPLLSRVSGPPAGVNLRESSFVHDLVLAFPLAPGIIRGARVGECTLDPTLTGKDPNMRPMTRALGLFVALAMLAGTLQGADPSGGLTKGTPEIKSAGPLAFGPGGILFIGDGAGAA